MMHQYVFRSSDGRFEIVDRGDGVAEITSLDYHGVVTEEVRAAALAFDLSFGRNPLPLPLGAPMDGKIIGFVNGVTGWDGSSDEPASAFPGWAQLEGRPREFVKSPAALALYLKRHG